jgi:hypothetical protein
MPPTIRLCGQEVVLEVSDPGVWAAGGMGRASIVDGKIALKGALPKSISDATLVHEIIHYILDSNGFRNLSGDEVLVSTFANSLTAFLKDNPDLVAELCKR